MNLEQAETEVNAVIYSNENNNVIPTPLAEAKYKYMKAAEEHYKAVRAYDNAYKELKKHGNLEEIYDFQKALAVVEYKFNLIPALNKWFSERFNFTQIQPKREWKFVGLYSWGMNGHTAVVQEIRLFSDFLVQMFYLNHLSSKANDWEIEKGTACPFFRLYIEDPKIIDDLNKEGGYENVDKFYTRQEHEMLSEDDSGWFMQSDDFDLLFNIAVKYNVRQQYDKNSPLPRRLIK